MPGIVQEKDGKRRKRELYGHPGYDRGASRVHLAARPQRGEKGYFVTKLEEVLPLLRERFGVTKIGIFWSTARGDDRPESDVDVRVELLPDHLTFRNFIALADIREIESICPHAKRKSRITCPRISGRSAAAGRPENVVNPEVLDRTPAPRPQQP